MNDPARLEGKLAIITGGGSGIGEATAKVFSEAGATVVVTGRRPEQLERVAKEIDGQPWPVTYQIKRRCGRCSPRPFRSLAR